MKKKFVGVRLSDDLLVRVKKMAGEQGRSVSETVGTLILQSLDSGPESRQAIDPESVKKAVESALRIPALDEMRAGIRDLGDLRAEIKVLERTIFDAQRMKPSGRPETGAAGGYPWTEGQVRFLIYTLARLNRFFEEYNAAWGQHDPQVGTRAETANGSGLRAVKKYLPGGDDHVR